jgi:hypothetical protein
MIQTIIVAIPGLLALIACIRRGPERAFLNVYLPALLLLPEHSWPISGQFTFVDTAIVPIALFLLFHPKQKWRWSSIDLLVIAYTAITVVAEGMNKGYKLGSQNLAIQELVSILLPYFAARHMFRHPQFAIDLAKRVVVLLSIVAIVSVYEFRMSSDLFTKPFDGIFPAIFTVVFRGGFLRTQGPYGHAITLGVMMALGFRVARWLEWNGVWKERMPYLPISKIRFCELSIIGGSFMSLSVGPWLAAACGSLVISVCRAQNRTRAVVSLALLIALFGGPIYTSFMNYISVDPIAAYAAGDQLQQDSAYRNMLLPLYVPIVEERPTWGWGRNGWPVLHRMWSIDNAYLFTALTFGLYALWLQVALFVWPPIRMLFFGIPLRRNDPRALAAFTMIGIYVMNVVMGGMAAGGGAPWSFLLVVAGWSTALLTGAPSEAVETEAVRAIPRTQLVFRRLGFRRVMA